MNEPATQPEDESDPPVTDEQDEAESERVEALVKRCVAQLCEHCDSVRIVVTTNRTNGNYGMFSWGNGNFYAQRDSVREWLIRQDQATKNDSD